jgi:iron complex outermembrane receptor protein
VRRTSDADTYSAGAAWQLNQAKTLTLYGNFNKAFTPTLQIQPDGTTLDPEQATQKEFGLRFSFLDGRMIGLVSHFDILQDKVVVSDPARLGYFLQLTGLHSKGEKFTLNTRITEQWYMMAGFTQVSSQQERSGSKLAQQPKNKATLVNRYAPSSGKLKGFSFIVGVIYTGDRPVGAITSPRVAPAFTIPSSLKLDTVVNYDFRPAGSRYKWNVGVKINNALDRTIIYSGTGSRYSTDPGRMVEVVTGVSY